MFIKGAIMEFHIRHLTLGFIFNFVVLLGTYMLWDNYALSLIFLPLIAMLVHLSLYKTVVYRHIRKKLSLQPDNKELKEQLPPLKESFSKLFGQLTAPPSHFSHYLDQWIPLILCDVGQRNDDFHYNHRDYRSWYIRSYIPVQVV